MKPLWERLPVWPPSTSLYASLGSAKIAKWFLRIRHLQQQKGEHRAAGRYQGVSDRVHAQYTSRTGQKCAVWPHALVGWEHRIYLLIDVGRQQITRVSSRKKVVRLLHGKMQHKRGCGPHVCLRRVTDRLRQRRARSRKVRQDVRQHSQYLE